MDSRAILLTLILVSSTLAGCTSDPDGGANDELPECEDAEDFHACWEDFLSGTSNTAWINDRGDSGQLWALSLSDDQWLEVKSAATVLHYEGNELSVTSFVTSEEGYRFVGFSPIFGGEYAWCTMSFGDQIPCANEDPDGDWMIDEWSIIYRVHDVAPANQYYSNSSPNESPPLLQHQNITLEVSYVPSGADNRVTGTIVIELYPNDAPLHVESFLSLIEGTYYNFTIFHRVIDGFVIQGGDFENHDGTGGYAGGWYGYCNGESTSDPCDQSEWTIPDEANNGLLHVPGVLAMAKTSAPNTGGSQFYIVPSDSTPSHLDGIHTVFGQVVSGMEHVDAISEVDTDQNDRPVNEVRLIHASVLN